MPKFEQSEIKTVNIGDPITFEKKVCSGCEYLSVRHDPDYLGHYCTFTTLRGRCIYKVKNLTSASNRDLLINGVRRRLLERTPPKWCPMERSHE